MASKERIKAAKAVVKQLETEIKGYGAQRTKLDKWEAAAKAKLAKAQEKLNKLAPAPTA